MPRGVLRCFKVTQLLQQKQQPLGTPFHLEIMLRRKNSCFWSIRYESAINRSLEYQSSTP
ncbi:MAG: hypothetical protein CMK50_01040 [Propionibacteriaceae bacterium]|nr:hypothetical protein [Propionibacteriaceae bacterium]